MIHHYRLRLYFIAAVILCAFSMLLSRLWYLQIENQQQYMRKLPTSHHIYHRLAGIRGNIYDRRKVALAENESTFEVGLNLQRVVESYKEKHRDSRGRDPQLPMHEWNVRADKEIDIYKIVQDTVVTSMAELGLYDAEHAINPEDLRIWYRTNKGEIPYRYWDRIPFEKFAIFAEHNDIPGVELNERALRKYPLKAFFGHGIGYLRRAEKKPDKEDEGKFKFYEGDDFGVAGLEMSLDKHLRGKPGRRTLLVNEHGRLVGEVPEEYQPPQPGEDVYLTIDARVQMICEMAMREAECTDDDGRVTKGIGRGAAVVMDPNTGEVLAMAAVPSYDPNTFIPSISQEDFDVYKNDFSGPLNNRAIMGFAPGSTFKIPVALAGFLTPRRTSLFYNCSGIVQYGNYPAPCWTIQKGMGGHGSLDLPSAIMRSCNCFFYQYGNSAGLKNIGEMAHMLGFGGPTGVELPNESLDQFPDLNYFQAAGKKATAADVAKISIGQAQVLATPLQMCTSVCAVANGGTVYQPTLVHHFEDRTNERRTIFTKKVKHNLLEYMKPENIARVREGMRRVVNDPGGTGRGAKSELEGVVIAGKTGTAQNKRVSKEGKVVNDNHTWFIAFAPYDKPKIAVAVLVSNGNSGGGTAAPVAKRIIEQTLSLENGAFKIDPKPLGEAKGHFRFTRTVSYEGQSVNPEDIANAESAIDDSSEKPVHAKALPEAAEPTIKPKAGGSDNDPRKNVKVRDKKYEKNN